MALTVFISDKESPSYDENKEFFAEFHKWALKNCPSYIGYRVHDISDATIFCDEIAEYRFNTVEDYTKFKKEWGEDENTNT